jgi:hypothetical protein
MALIFLIESNVNNDKVSNDVYSLIVIKMITSQIEYINLSAFKLIKKFVNPAAMLWVF